MVDPKLSGVEHPDKFAELLLKTLANFPDAKEEGKEGAKEGEGEDPGEALVMGRTGDCAPAPSGGTLQDER